MPEFERIACDNIEATAATQVRIRLDRAIIDEYTEAFQNGADMPPIDVFREPNSERVILADGFHRHRAAINAGREDIGCNVHEGGMHDALMYALGANAEHGMRRTQADRRHAVEMALKDPELSKQSSRFIADVCRVGKSTVNRIINEHLAKDKEKEKGGPMGQKKKPKKPTDKDVRDNGKKLTQEQVEADEVREALKAIMVLPYDGPTAAGRLLLDKDDIANAEYVSTWLAGLVIECRKPRDEDE